MGLATRNIVSSNKPRQNRKYSIIVPAAGAGHRMKKYGPKPLIKIDQSTTIFDRQCKIFYDTFRWCEIILVAGFEYDKIQRSIGPKIKLINNKDYDDTNVIHSIGLGIRQCSTENIIIAYGDLVFNQSCIEVAFDQESCAVICNTMKDEEVGCNIDNGYIQQMFYGITNKWAQIIFLRGEELVKFSKYATDDMNYNKYGFEGINHVIETGGKIRSLQPKKAKVIDIDSPLDLKEINKII